MNEFNIAAIVFAILMNACMVSDQTVALTSGEDSPNLSSALGVLFGLLAIVFVVASFV